MHDFTSAQRQPIVAITIILVKFLRKVLRAMWPILLVLFFGQSSNWETQLGYLIAGVSGISVIGSVVSYFRFYFHIQDDELIIEKGILERKKISIPLNRIQAVDLEQKLLHQFFNVVAINIDTAGSKKSEVTIDALYKPDAERFKKYLLSHRQSTTDHEVTTDIAHEKEELIFRLEPRDLVKIGVSQNHIQTAGIILAFGVGLLENFEAVLGFDYYDQIGEYIKSGFQSFLFTLAILIPVLLIFSFIFTLGRTVINYYNFSFVSTQKGFRSKSGLLTVKEKSANSGKIQLVRSSTDPIKRIFKLSRIKVFQASSDVMGKKQAMILPGVTDEQKANVYYRLFPERILDFPISIRISKLIIRRIFAYGGLLPFLILLGFYFVTKISWVLGGALFIPVSIWGGYRYFRNAKIRFNSQALSVTRGVFTIKTDTLELYKIQAISLTRNIFQRRHNLASLRIYTASGGTIIPYIPLSQAKQIQDFFLYQVESSNRVWM
jgi:putative membrane protein